jgi:hypothetical protein
VKHPKKNGTGAEEGVCILCGRQAKGCPAREDLEISAARHLRSMLRMEPHHTVACGNCLQACVVKRKAFERTRGTYRTGAIVFFLLVVAGSLVYGRADALLAIPALIGSAIIYLLSWGRYFPSFQIHEGN